LLVSLTGPWQCPVWVSLLAGANEHVGVHGQPEACPSVRRAYWTAISRLHACMPVSPTPPCHRASGAGIVPQRVQAGGVPHPQRQGVLRRGRVSECCNSCVPFLLVLCALSVQLLCLISGIRLLLDAHMPVYPPTAGRVTLCPPFQIQILQACSSAALPHCVHASFVCIFPSTPCQLQVLQARPDRDHDVQAGLAQPRAPGAQRGAAGGWRSGVGWKEGAVGREGRQGEAAEPCCGAEGPDSAV